MINVNIALDGFDQVFAMFDPDGVRNALDRAVDRGADALVSDINMMPEVSVKTTGYGPHGMPFWSGELRESIHKEKTRLLAADVVASAGHALKVIEGQGSMPPRDYFDWALNEFGGLSDIEDIVNEELAKVFV